MLLVIPLTENAVYNTSGKLIIPTIEENKNRLATLHSKLIKSKQNELLDNILLDDNIKRIIRTY